ncbi:MULTISPECIES: VirB3 family type IV secretion system protein [unclassified Treponema]|uniref:VirB3 family type IV secretion system protein n=1 Tax=unclassified Treponema TaxID=2638727 RepID=UPI0020A47C58|nr:MULTISPECIES: VirB3 family type IV secretion system protein [unclassified Treponema]UTC44678.1 hypothetical protein E4N66_11675 [Treponema sp. OMZ 857]UTC49857.1 VirB3 family type IV secretion system protein [Treponema sp. OMZ 855]
MEMISDYAIPVHRSLIQVDMLFGIGTKAAILLLIVTVVMIQITGAWFLIVSAALFFLMRLLAKHDPYLLDILFDSVLQQDIYYG